MPADTPAKTSIDPGAAAQCQRAEGQGAEGQGAEGQGAAGQGAEGQGAEGQGDPAAAEAESAPPLRRLAAIDIGTNSIRLIVAEPLRGGNYRILDEERVSTRLGRKLASTGKLQEKAVRASLDALGRFQKIAAGFGVEPNWLRTIATCAVREAENGEQFRQQALEELGLEIEVISAEREAHLAFHSVRSSFDLSDRNVVLADIGGGSTEIVLASGNLIEAIYPTGLGTVRMSEIYGSGQALAGSDYEQMIAGIDKRLKKETHKAKFATHLMIGSGGTFTSLAGMIMAAKNQEGLPVRGYQVRRSELKHLLDLLRKQSPKARRSTPGLNPERADIIVAGLAIVDRIMRRYKVNMLQVHNRGVRDGLLLTMLEEAQVGSATSPVDRDAAVDRFAEACGGETEHGRHVALLAGQMYAQLSEPFELPPEDRPLMETAARLQDVGYLINYDRHHKHSYHLILNSRLPGFKPHELELIANVARYHRAAEPKKKHDTFRQLAPHDRQRVRRLAALVRLAGGMDRSHTQQVRGVQVTVGENDVEFRLEADRYPDVDLWGARRRAGLFEKVFKTAASVEWSGNSQPEAQDASQGSRAAG